MLRDWWSIGWAFQLWPQLCDLPCWVLSVWISFSPSTRQLVCPSSVFIIDKHLVERIYLGLRTWLLLATWLQLMLDVDLLHAYSMLKSKGKYANEILACMSSTDVSSPKRFIKTPPPHSCRHVMVLGGIHVFWKDYLSDSNSFLLTFVSHWPSILYLTHFACNGIAGVRKWIQSGQTGAATTHWHLGAIYSSACKWFWNVAGDTWRDYTHS